MDLREAIDGAKSGRKSMVKCPAHDDGTSSLAVSPGTGDQPVILHCHAGCETPDVIAADGIEWSEVCAPLDPTVHGVWTPKGDASHVYSYTDEEGHELFQCLRVPQANGKKTFFQRHSVHEDGQDRMVWTLQGVRRVLYRLPSIMRAIENGLTIWLFEGEKDVHTALIDGLAATCNPMGAGPGKWQPEYTATLRGADVVIVRDRDEPGEKHADHVYAELVEADCHVRIVETPFADAKDYTDHRALGGNIGNLVTIRDSAPPDEDSGGVGIQAFCEAVFQGDQEIIPNMLAEANVGIITGFEGHGKSMLLRQIAACAAGGIRPLHGDRMEPVRTVMIDAENPEHQQQMDWRTLAGLAARHTGQAIDNDHLIIYSQWRATPDLTSMAGAQWLADVVQRHRPQLVCLGPIYNMSRRDVKDDEVVTKIKDAINAARAICGTAFLIEHHAPHRAPGDKTRSVRPYGSSTFMKWPDLGYGLKPTDSADTYELEPWRKPRVRRRAWPEAVRIGTPNTMEFPWEIAQPLAPVHQIR